MGEPSADCVIVGGGIGGAVLALTLGRSAHRVVILEREAHPPAVGRPEILARSTIEVFDRLGAGERLMQEAAIPLRRLELWRSGGGCILQLQEEDFRRVGAQPYSTDPAATRRILLETAIATGHVEVHRGVEAHTLLRDGSRVIGVAGRRGEESVVWHGRLVVGDDGGRSHIRAALGISLEFSELPLEFLTAAGPALDVEDGVGQAWIQPSALRDGIAAGIFMPLPAERTAMAFLASPATCERLLHAAPAEFYDAAIKLSPRDRRRAERYRFPERFAHIRRPFGHAARYVDDGAVLMGDAAHPVTPAGGQGANMSVADGVALAEVAQQALSLDDCSSRQLEAYETLRRPANERSLQFSVRTNRALRMLQRHSWLAALLPLALGYVGRSRRLKMQLIRSVSQAFASVPRSA